MVLVLLMTLLSIKMIDTLIRTLQRRTVIRSIINMPQNATPSFTIVISCDSCMFTNPNVDVQVKKKRDPIRLTQSTSGLGKRQTLKSLVAGSDT